MDGDNPRIVGVTPVYRDTLAEELWGYMWTGAIPGLSDVTPVYGDTLTEE